MNHLPKMKNKKCSWWTGLGVGRVNLVCVATERSLLNHFDTASASQKINIFFMLVDGNTRHRLFHLQPHYSTRLPPMATSCVAAACRSGQGNPAAVEDGDGVKADPPLTFSSSNSFASMVVPVVVG
jgi:hypothetical protein